MDNLKMAENIVFLRKKRDITQGALAEFLGVTKASVSKWETGQSLPDILLLPRIASYFDISIDELMGYQAQLKPEEIRNQYQKFAEDFAVREFQEVLTETREFTKQYYSCYPALLQIVLLWVNHHMLAESEEQQKEILQEAISLCRHVEEQCADMRICGDASAYQSIACLMLGDFKEVIRILEPQHDPRQMLGRAEGILIQAYQMSGQRSKAEAFNQYAVYNHLLALLNDSISYMASQVQDAEAFGETSERIREVMRVYRIDELHPNTALQFYLQNAVFYCVHGNADEALVFLRSYLEVGEHFIKKGFSLHGDQYFNRIEDYFEQFDLGPMPPRSEQTVWDSFRQTLDLPAFAPLQEHEEFRRMKRKLEEN